MAIDETVNDKIRQGNPVKHYDSAGSRVFDMTLNGQPLSDGATYGVAMSNFLQQGGDGFTMFARGATLAEGGTDLDALEADQAASRSAFRSTAPPNSCHRSHAPDARK